jgi:hypothetical protein
VAHGRPRRLLPHRLQQLGKVQRGDVIQEMTGER